MLRSRITPFLLLRGESLVKTQRFGNPKYLGDPINAVKIFNEKAVDELVLLDIHATASGRGPHFSLLRDIAAESRMPLCYGGGIRDAETAARLVALGYEKVSVSHAAVERPELISEMAERLGSQSVVVTLDVKREGLFGGHRLYTRNASNKHKLEPVAFAKECEERGAGEIVLNAIDRDGMMQGYDIDFARKVRETVTVPMTIVGGAGSAEHMRELVSELGPIGAGAGSLFVFKGKYRAVLISYSRP